MTSKMKTFQLNKNGYHVEVQAKSINDVRRSLMKKGNEYYGFLTWVNEGDTWRNRKYLGQVRYDYPNKRFIWYKGMNDANVLNKDGSIGRRI